MPQYQADTSPGPGLWRCPNCWRGWMHPATGEQVGLGPFTTICDFCGFEMDQTLDNRQDSTGPGDHRPGHQR